MGIAILTTSRGVVTDDEARNLVWAVKFFVKFGEVV